MISKQYKSSAKRPSMTWGRGIWFRMPFLGSGAGIGLARADAPSAARHESVAWSLFTKRNQAQSSGLSRSANHNRQPPRGSLKDAPIAAAWALAARFLSCKNTRFNRTTIRQTAKPKRRFFPFPIANFMAERAVRENFVQSVTQLLSFRKNNKHGVTTFL